MTTERDMKIAEEVKRAIVKALGEVTVCNCCWEAVDVPDHCYEVAGAIDLTAIVASIEAEPASVPARVDQKNTGLYRKFNVSRVDGRDAPGGDRHGAEYVVLDMTYDPNARAALTAYAAACAVEYPKLAADFRALRASHGGERA